MNCGRSSSVEWKLPKLQRRVRFPSPAPPPPGCAPGGFVMPPRQARLACHALFYLPLAPLTQPCGRRVKGQNSPSTRPSRVEPVQNSPSSQPSRRHRYKTPPARSPAGDTGTKLSLHPQNGPFQHVLRQQGELYTACATNKPSRENFVPHAGPMPVQNSPSSQPSGRHRYKTPPAPPKWPISARFTPAGRTSYHSHHQQVEQGEKSPAPTPHLTHQRAPPTISHAILLHEFSTKPRNVAIPTT